MPRIPPAIIRRASAIDRLLPQLLPVCRDLHSAQNELRWLREHAAGSNNVSHPGITLKSLVTRRATGEPLQYVLGSEYFGDLEIKCRPSVLIPRQETAAAVQYLVRRIHSRCDIRVLDLCTGTGCIALLFHHEFYRRAENVDAVLNIVGVDVSKQACALANENSQSLSNRTVHEYVSFVQADIFDEEVLQSKLIAKSNSHKFDILISNPPYISNAGFRATTARSVRTFEPRLALVPESHHHHGHDILDGDAFYPRLVDVAEKAEASVLLVEVADIDQARRVATLIARRQVWDEIEIWRDDPEASDRSSECIEGQNVLIRGKGNGRTVFAYRSAPSGFTIIKA